MLRQLDWPVFYEYVKKPYCGKVLTRLWLILTKGECNPIVIYQLNLNSPFCNEPKVKACENPCLLFSTIFYSACANLDILVLISCFFINMGGYESCRYNKSISDMIACAPFCMSLLPYVISFLPLSMLLSAIRSVNSDKSSKKSYKRAKCLLQFLKIIV